jgi:hypothetical protein
VAQLKEKTKQSVVLKLDAIAPLLRAPIPTVEQASKLATTPPRGMAFGAPVSPLPIGDRSARDAPGFAAPPQIGPAAPPTDEMAIAAAMVPMTDSSQTSAALRPEYRAAAAQEAEAKVRELNAAEAKGAALKIKISPREPLTLRYKDGGAGPTPQQIDAVVEKHTTRSFYDAQERTIVDYRAAALELREQYQPRQVGLTSGIFVPGAVTDAQINALPTHQVPGAVDLKNLFLPASTVLPSLHQAAETRALIEQQGDGVYQKVKDFEGITGLSATEKIEYLENKETGSLVLKGQITGRLHDTGEPYLRPRPTLNFSDRYALEKDKRPYGDGSFLDWQIGELKMDAARDVGLDALKIYATGKLAISNGKQLMAGGGKSMLAFNGMQGAALQYVIFTDPKKWDLGEFSYFTAAGGVISSFSNGQTARWGIEASKQGKSFRFGMPALDVSAETLQYRLGQQEVQKLLNNGPLDASVDVLRARLGQQEVQKLLNNGPLDASVDVLQARLGQQKIQTLIGEGTLESVSVPGQAAAYKFSNFRTAAEWGNYSMQDYFQAYGVRSAAGSLGSWVNQESLQALNDGDVQIGNVNIPQALSPFARNPVRVLAIPHSLPHPDFVSKYLPYLWTLPADLALSATVRFATQPMKDPAPEAENNMRTQVKDAAPEAEAQNDMRTIEGATGRWLDAYVKFAKSLSSSELSDFNRGVVPETQQVKWNEVLDAESNLRSVRLKFEIGQSQNIAKRDGNNDEPQRADQRKGSVKLDVRQMDPSLRGVPESRVKDLEKLIAAQKSELEELGVTRFRTLDPEKLRQP